MHSGTAIALKYLIILILTSWFAQYFPVQNTVFRPRYNATISTLLFRIYLESYRNKQIKQFQLTLSDRDSWSVYKEDAFKIDGFHLLSDATKRGYQTYRLKILKEIRLQNYGKYPCKHYQPGVYNQCLEKELLEETRELLNCTPPWINHDERYWCGGKLNISRQNSEQIKQFFQRIFYGKYSTGKCPRICMTTR